MTVLSAALLLFLVLDPFGNIPFYLSALQQVPPARQRRVVVRELIFALVALVVFLFGGRFVLGLLSISEPALTTAGGIILFLIAIRMIFPPAHSGSETVEGEPFIFPLAVPYVAGPSALAAVMFLTSREPERWPEWLAAVFAAWLATGVILFLASALRRRLGQRGLIAAERLMGMVLVTMAVQMLMGGLHDFWVDS
ncbi:MAG: MarC family protein [Candidatus Eiseniibacteriota bacterium]